MYICACMHRYIVRSIAIAIAREIIDPRACAPARCNANCKERTSCSPAIRMHACMRMRIYNVDSL